MYKCIFFFVMFLSCMQIRTYIHEQETATCIHMVLSHRRVLIQGGSLECSRGGPNGPPLGLHGPGPDGPPWALMGRALMGLLCPYGPGPYGPPGASWAGPLCPPGPSCMQIDIYNIYIYICICLRMQVYICMSLYVDTYIYVYMYLYVNIHIYIICIYIKVYVCKYT